MPLVNSRLDPFGCFDEMDGVTSTVSIEDFAFAASDAHGQDANGNGQSSIAAVLNGSMVTWKRVALTAGGGKARLSARLCLEPGCPLYARRTARCDGANSRSPLAMAAAPAKAQPRPSASAGPR